MLINSLSDLASREFADTSVSTVTSSSGTCNLVSWVYAGNNASNPASRQYADYRVSSLAGSKYVDTSLTTGNEANNLAIE